MSKKTKFIVRAFLLLMCLFPGTKDVEFEGWGMKLKIHTPTHKAPGEVLFLCPADSNLKCNTCNQVRFADVITSFVLVLSTTSA